MTSPLDSVEDTKITVKKSTAEQIKDILDQPGIPILHKILHARGVAESHIYDLPKYPTNSQGVLEENQFIRRVLRLLGPRDREMSLEEQKLILTETRELVETSVLKSEVL